MAEPDLMFKNVRGVGTLRENPAGLIYCEEHGYKYLPTSIFLGWEELAACGRCLADLPELAPLISDPVCQDDVCMRHAQYLCRLCNKRYCTQHMFAAQGDRGLCNKCLDREDYTNTSGVPDAAEGEFINLSQCTYGPCEYTGVVYCHVCRQYYCELHMSKKLEMCKGCAGEYEKEREPARDN